MVLAGSSSPTSIYWLLLVEITQILKEKSSLVNKLPHFFGHPVCKVSVVSSRDYIDRNLWCQEWHPEYSSILQHNVKLCIFKNHFMQPITQWIVRNKHLHVMLVSCKTIGSVLHSINSIPYWSHHLSSNGEYTCFAGTATVNRSPHRHSTRRRFVHHEEIGCNKWKKTLAYLLVLPGSRARIVRCGGRYDPQLVKRSSESVSALERIAICLLLIYKWKL